LSTAAIRRYWTRLVDGGCCICGGPAEVAHTHGGSIVERLKEPKAKGRKLPYMDFLVLPLCMRHHRIGPTALDNDVDAWESIFGEQAIWIDNMKSRTGIDAWAEARALMKPTPQRKTA
jgi:hypothetical protein